DWPDQFLACNEVTVGPFNNPVARSVACTKAIIDADVDFRYSVKSVDPLLATLGDPMTYTIDLVNSGKDEVFAIHFMDTFPDCVDDTNFDVVRDVELSPGTFTGSYNRLTRTLDLILSSDLKSGDTARM